MKINKVIAESGSQANIADRIDRIDFSTGAGGLSTDELAQFKKLLSCLDEVEVSEVSNQVIEIKASEQPAPMFKKLKEKFDELGRKYGAPLAESLTSSALYDLLKSVFGVG